jgi:hypothetical protein
LVSYTYILSTMITHLHLEQDYSWEEWKLAVRSVQYSSSLSALECKCSRPPSNVVEQSHLKGSPPNSLVCRVQ